MNYQKVRKKENSHLNMPSTTGMHTRIHRGSRNLHARFLAWCSHRLRVRGSVVPHQGFGTWLAVRQADSSRSPWPGAFSFLSPQVNTRDSGGKRCGMFANTSTDAICSQTNIHDTLQRRLKPRPHRLPLAYTCLRILIHDRTRMKTYDEYVRTRYVSSLIYICKHKFHSR